MNHLFFSILFLVCICTLSADAIEKQELQPWKKYAIYLTTGSQAQSDDAEWGGCHITLAGFHRKHGNEALLNKLPQIIKESSTTLEGWRPGYVRVQKWGKQWAVVFYSRTLNKIAQKLAQEGFKRVKGPEFSKSAFHMVLPHLKDQQTAKVFAHSLKEKEWFVTLVEMKPSEPSFHHARWLQYFHL